jgi:hypothetical protein
MYMENSWKVSGGREKERILESEEAEYVRMKTA